jgi:aldose 1-epimerase
MSGAIEIVRIAAGNVEVEVVPEIGARLHRLRVRGHDLLRTPADVGRHRDDPYFWGSYPLAPWCNRIASGRTPGVAGRDLDLPATFPDGTAIHGQVSQARWSRTDERTFTVRGGGDGWPWPYQVEQHVAPGDDRFALTLRLTNLADSAMPAGVGVHPWFRRPVAVQIAAAEVYPSNLGTNPEPEPARGRLDRRALEPLPDGLDATWTSLDRPPVTLAWPDAKLRATIDTNPSVDYIVAASPAGIDGVAVEPETHAPDGLRRLLRGEPGGLTMLPAGATLSLEIALVISGQT